MALAFASMMASTQAVPANSLTLWYDQPAEKWVQAVPIGNVRLGAMIFGQPRNERLQFNDVTVWSGGPQPDADRRARFAGVEGRREEDVGNSR